MECVILVRHPNGSVVAMNEGDENPMVFDNRDQAIECAETQPFCQAFPYQIVELDEL